MEIWSDENKYLEGKVIVAQLWVTNLTEGVLQRERGILRQTSWGVYKVKEVLVPRSYTY